MKTKSIIHLGAALILLLAACKPKYQQPDSTSISVKNVVVEKLTPSTTPIPLVVSGVINSKIEARLSFKLTGVIQRILVDEGQTVKKGQLLAHLNLSEINAQVVQAQHQVDKAARDLDRVRNLHRDSVATLEQLQDLETLLEVSKADLRIARFNQQYARIVAPTNGKILKRYAEQGELISAGAPILMIGSHGQRSSIMRVALADRDVVKLINGDSASIEFDAYPGKRFSAAVTEIAEAANPQTGTFEIELTLDPSRLVLKSGFIGKATIYPSEQQEYFRINMNALVEGHQQNASIYLYNNRTGKAEISEIEPVHIDDGFFTVAVADLEGHRHIITDGSAYIKDGEVVEPLNLMP